MGESSNFLYTVFIIALLFLSLVPSVHSQVDIYPWELDIEYPDDDSSNPFELSDEGKVSISFVITNSGLLSLDISIEYEKAFPGTYSGVDEITIPANSNETLNLEVSKIDVLNFAAREQSTFIITATLESIQGTPQLSPSVKDAEGKLLIPIIYSLDIEITDPVGPMNAGSSMPLRVTVTNDGNIEDRVGDVEISDNCPLLTANNGLDSLMTTNLNPGKSTNTDFEISASESHPRRNCKVEITIASNGAMNTGKQSLVMAEVQIDVDPPLKNSDTNDGDDDSTTTTTEVIGSSLPFMNLFSVFCCIFAALIFARKN